MTKPSFLSRDFVLLWQGQFVNQTGSQIALVAAAFWLKQSTDSASLVGLLTAISALPLLLLGPLGGAFADRWSRRNILIVCDACAGLVACALAVLLRIHAPKIAYLTIGVFAANLVFSSAVAFTLPALNSLIISLVPAEQIGSAMAFSQGSGLLTLILGQTLGGLLLTRFLPAVLFWIDGATYFISATAELFVRADTRMRPENTPARGRLFHEISEGFRYVWQKPGMRALLLAAIPLNVLSTPVIVLLPFYTTNALRDPLTRYGYLLVAISVGMLAGYAWGGRFPPSARNRHAAAFACVLACGLSVLALAFVPVFFAALIFLGIQGCLMGLITLISLTALMQHTEPEMRGRVSGVLVMVTQGLSPLAMALIGVISDVLGNNIRLLYGSCGVLLTGAAIVMAVNKDLREFLKSSA